jgi:RF-1 domain
MTDGNTADQHGQANDTHPASWTEEKLLAQCRMTFSRASGPGGQNRNKVETSVQIEFLPNKIIASASERRTQNENRKVALQRLRCKLAVEIQMTAARDGQLEQELHASETWLQYCRGGRVDIAETNSDWPTVLAELIGILKHCDWNLSEAAKLLESSSSQLVKLLKKCPPAFKLLNEERRSRGNRLLD